MTFHTKQKHLQPFKEHSPLSTHHSLVDEVQGMSHGSTCLLVIWRLIWSHLVGSRGGRGGSQNSGRGFINRLCFVVSFGSHAWLPASTRARNQPETVCSHHSVRAREVEHSLYTQTSGGWLFCIKTNFTFYLLEKNDCYQVLLWSNSI